MDASLDIDSWLQQIGLAQYGPIFRANDVDLRLLLRLSDADLRDIGVVSLGHRRHLLTAVAELAASPVAVASLSHTAASGLAPERRQLTVLFGDLVGSTALSTRMDPEDLRALIRSYQQTASSYISRFDGHLAQFLGDGVLAYFGWPRAHEDDAERAVRAALAISKAVCALPSPGADPLMARVGIATGLVVVGDLIGEGSSQQHAVTGETPNLAARLQGVAPEGGVVIGASTRQLVGDAFVLRDLGALELKGIAKPVVAYGVLDERPLESRFAARHGSGIAAMVGRDDELAALRNRWQGAMRGSMQVVLLTGEAGIGKSRVAEAIVQEVQSDSAHVLRYQCSPYHSDTPLHPVVQELALATGLASEDALATKLDRLERLLGSIGLAHTSPLMAALLGLDGSQRYGTAHLAPSEQRQLTLTALVERLAAQSLKRPVLWLIEDVHWVDPSTLELLALALDRLCSSRVLLLLTARPGFEAPFTGREAFAHLELSRLDRAATRNVVMRVTRGKELPTPVLDEILTKADGLPLFIEEITKAVIESGGLRETPLGYQLEGPTHRLSIPASLQDSLMARLDRLAPLKALAQLAASIGREFPYDLLRALKPADEPALQRQLAGLVAAELIASHGAPPNLSYSFKHALIRDAAYESLLKSTRRHYHCRIGEVLRQQFPETAAAHPELLAQHFTEAGLAAEAITYWERAGEHAVARSAYQEAIGHLTQGLQLVSDLPAGVNRLQAELQLQVAIAPAFDATKGVSSLEVQRAYDRAWEICLELGDTPFTFSVLMGLRRCYFVRGDLVRAKSVVERLVNLAKGSGDRMQLIETNLGFGVTSLWRGEISEALLHLERGTTHFSSGMTPLVSSRQSVRMSDPLVSCLAYSSWALWMGGFPHKALTRSHEALEYSRRLEHPVSIALALDFSAALHEFRGEAQEALTLSNEGVALCEQHGFSFWLSLLIIRRGWALSSLGQTSFGLEEVRKGVDIWKQTGAGLARPFLLVLLSEVLMRAGVIDEALEHLGEASRDGNQREELFFEAEVHRLKGELLLLGKQHSQAQAQAQASFRRALEVAAKQGAKSLALRAAISLARHGYLAQDPSLPANGLLASWYSTFTEGHETSDLLAARRILVN